MKLDRRGLTLIELMVAMLILLILMTVLASFMLSASMGATTSRRSAWNGQAVERALTMLRHELAGATEVSRENENQLYYYRVRADREEHEWILMIEDGSLIRRSQNDPNLTVILAKDINYFEFVLPRENVDEEGYIIPTTMLWVMVGAGNFKLDDSIYLRNYLN